MQSQITSSYLEAKWASIDVDHIKAYRFQRISAESLLEINIGLNQRGDRCLILELPRNNGLVFFNRVRQNLSMFHIPEQDYIVVALLDPFFNDVFTDLIVSLYHQIKHITEVESCARELIGAFTKWSEFFIAKDTPLLSDSALKGLWGELFMLREFLFAGGGGQTDLILDSWKGPYDLTHDFVFADRNIEIKTREAGHTDISISSEFQLEPEFEKPLELIVLDIQENSGKGQSIAALVEVIRQLIREGLGDSQILLRGLAQKGLHMRNISVYPQSFIPINSTIYDCTADGFPKVSRSDLDPAIHRIKYSIRTNGLDRFILNQIEY